MAISSLDSAANSIGFDRSTGKLSIFGTAGNNTVQEWISDDGYLQLRLDGQTKSSDPLSAFFDSRLQGATRDTLTHINFDGGEGRDTLLVGNQSMDNLEIAADDDILINGNAIIATGNLDVSADTITATGSLTGSNINLNSRDALKLESGTKITSQVGDKGGTVHLLGQEVSLTGVAIDASGLNGGGTVLIGGDYQGKGSVPNARTTFIEASTVINVDALQNGDGGRAIVWADDTTRFLGKINARGGRASGDGGFAEVSGKQNLLFQGLADLSATRGAIGTLLLDPNDIIISDAPVDPSDPPEPQMIDAASLEESAASISLVATNSIYTTNLNFVSPGGSISFIAGAGGFTGGNITALGRDIELTSEGEIVTGNVYTFSNNGSQSGNITITSTEGGIQTRDIHAGSDGGNAGKVTMNAAGDIRINGLIYAFTNSTGNGNGGDVSLISESGDITTGLISTRTPGSGIGGSVLFTAIDGGITAGDVSVSSGSGDGGAITINATSDINTGYLATNTFGTGTGGNIDISSMSGSINTNGGGIASNSWFGSAGKIALQAAGTIDTGEVNSRSDATGNGGDIKLEATENITTAELRSYVYGNGNSGNINVKSDNGIIDIKEVQSGAYGLGTAGNIDITSTSSSINTNGGMVSSDSWSGTAGNITLLANDTIATGEVNSRSDGPGNAGNIDLKATGNITTGELRSHVYGNGNSGNISVKSASGFVDVKEVNAATYGEGIAGNIDIASTRSSINTNGGMVSSDSWSGTGGNITLLASDAIATGEVKSSSGGASNGGAIALTSTDGNITTGSIRSDSTQGTGGNITIDAAKLVKVTGSENIDGIDYSIYTDSVDDASGPKGASVTISNSQKVLSTPSTFIIGDATINGTFAGVSDGVATFDTSEGGIHAFVVDSDWNDIHIKMPTFIASSGSPVLDSALDKAIKGMLPFLKGLSPSSTLTPLDQVKTLVSVLPQVTLQQILQIAPDANPQKASQLLPYLNVAMAIYGINKPIRKSHFFAQLIQESDSFNATEEYADGSDYEGRLELGNTEPGDGKRFKGRGLIQITGRTVYTDFSNHLGLGQTLLKLPQLVSTNPALATLSAGYFWKIFKGEDLSLKADQDVETNSEEILRYITQTVNGGLFEGEPTYLSRRRVYLSNAKQFFPN